MGDVQGRVIMKINDIYIGRERLTDILGAELELEGDYVQHLLDADDWTMMILSWAIVEACLNQAISKRLDNESLSSFVERLNIGGRSGKAELAASLGVLTKEERKFLEVYSEVRNRFAHGVKRFKTTFEEFFASLDDPSRFENALFWREVPDCSEAESISFKTDKRYLVFVNVTMLCVNIIRRSQASGAGTVPK